MRRRVAVVTGASRGVGRGVATELCEQGFKVHATARTIAGADLPSAVRRIPCDHTDLVQVADAFQVVEREDGRIDVLVNCAWGGYERMVEDGEFTWPDPFWRQPAWRWEAMMVAGLRAAWTASQHAARLMIEQKVGLIVHLSYWAARKHMGNAIYGIAKAATDKMAADMATELRDHGVACVSLYPGLVRTEAVLASGAFDLTSSESPAFIGRAVAALADDPHRLSRTGQVLVAAQLAREYGFTDVDGATPEPLTLEQA